MKRIVSLLLTVSAVATAQPTILYFNDAHEIAPLEDGARGGLARVATRIQEVRSENPDTLVVFGGDLVGGTLFGTFQGQPIVAAFNLMGIDLANFGQHEFDFGAEVARERVAESDFTWLSSNLVEQDGQPFAGVPTTVIRELGGIKIGFIGLTTALETSNAGADVRQRDPLEAATEAVDALKAEQVDKIVVIAQQSLEEDFALAQALPDIDLILSEEQSETVTAMSAVGHTSIAKSAGNVTSVVQAELLSERVNLSVLPIDDTVAEDPEVAALAERTMSELESRLAERVTSSPLALDASAEANRVGGTVLGNLIADSYRAVYDADIGLINGGGIRSDRSYPAGELTLRDLNEVLPFNDKVVLLEVEGSTLLAALEHGVANVEELDGRFPQVSGVRYSFEPAKPAGSRILEVTVGGEPLEASKRYTLATRAYLASGGDGYSMLNSAAMLVPPADGEGDVVALQRYLEDTPTFDKKNRALSQ